MENLAYLYVLAEEAALPETNLQHIAEPTEDHPSCVSQRAFQRHQSREGGKAALEGDRDQPTYPTFYL